MAGGYSALKVIVTADTKGLSLQIRNEATRAGEDAAQSIGSKIGAGLKALAPVGQAVFRAVGTAIAATTVAATGFGVSAFMAAARVGEMDATLKALAKTNQVSYPVMQQQVAAIRKQGIEYGVAQNVVAQFTRSQLKLTDATKLATVAQDAAVISGQNSSDTLDQLIHGVTTQNSLVLRNAGINVQAGQAMDAYAKSLGKTSKELTTAERSQAVLNAVLKEGGSVAGAYEAALKEPGKVLRSFPRIIDDIKISVGRGLLSAFSGTILGAYDLAKAFSLALEPGGKLAPVFDAIGVAAAKIAAPIEQAIAAATRFITALNPAQIASIVGVIEKLGPAIAVAAAAITVFASPGIIGGLPIIGPIIADMIAPVTLLAKQLGSVAVAASGGKVAVGSLGAVLGGPVSLAVLAVVAAVALLTATSAPFRKAMVDIGRSAVEAFRAALPGVKAFLSGLLPVVAVVVELGRAVGGALGPALSALAPALVPLGSLFGSLLTVIGGLLKVVAAVLIPVIRLAGALAALVVVNVTVPYFARFAQILATVANWIATVVRWIFGGSPGLIPAFLALNAVVGSVMGSITGLVVGGFRAMASAIASAHAAITSAISGAWSRIRSVITSGVSAARSAVQAGASAMLSVIRSMASGFASSGAAAGNALRSSISSGINAARSAVTSAVSAMIAAARSLVGGFASAGASAASAMAGAISGGLSGIVGMVQSKLAGIVSAAKSALAIGSPSKIMWAVGLDFVGGFIGAILASPMAATVAAAFAVLPAAAAGALRPAGLPAGAGGGDAVGPALTSGPSLGDIGDTGLMRALDEFGRHRATAGGVVVNVYPQAGQSETEIAAAVSRRLDWAIATGRAE